MTQTTHSPRVERPETKAEIEYKHFGKVERVTQLRETWAECTDPECGAVWEGQGSLGASGGHVVSTGHEVNQYYSVVFVARPNTDKSLWTKPTTGRKRKTPPSSLLDPQVTSS